MDIDIVEVRLAAGSLMPLEPRVDWVPVGLWVTRWVGLDTRLAAAKVVMLEMGVGLVAMVKVVMLVMGVVGLGWG